jgi:hypothetical protein
MEMTQAQYRASRDAKIENLRRLLAPRAKRLHDEGLCVNDIVRIMNDEGYFGLCSNRVGAQEIASALTA